MELDDSKELNLQMIKSLLHVKKIVPLALYQKWLTKGMIFEKRLG